ncbi:RNA-binding domain-containing protein [Deltaproteobacteria bacterium TL4]
MSEITQRILSGEDSVTEFKSANFRNESLAKEVVAFLNMSGGIILIGVEDDGGITGITEPKQEEKIVNICRNHIEPSIIPEIHSHLLQGKKIFEVIIPKGDSKPYKVKSLNRFYIRAGSVSIEPSTQELIRLFQAGSIFHYEVSSLPGTTLEDMDLVRFRDYCEHYRLIEFDVSSWEQEAVNWQLADPKKQWTVVGALFFCRTPQKYLPQCGIQLFRFQGLDKTGEILDHKEVNQVLPETIATAIKFVENNSHIRGVFDTRPERKDVYDYEPFAIRELIVNAFCHRDWSIFGQMIRLSMFDDRLEIFSPGGLPNTLTLESALSGVSYYRNPNVAQMFKDYRLSEKAGRGLQRILKYSQEQGIPSPVFECRPDYLNITLTVKRDQSK